MSATLAPNPTTCTEPRTAERPAARIEPLLPVVGGDLAVPVVDGGLVGYANLDYAASAPALRSVADFVAQALPYYASVHRGAGYASQVSTALYETSRQEIGRFVGARPDDVVVVTRNTTDSLALLGSAVRAAAEREGHRGDVLVLDVEHHANLLPWTAGPHRVLPTGGTLAETLDLLRLALAERPAALVAVTGASNVTGELAPLAEVIALAHRAGARVVVDAAQLAPHRRIDLAELDADYLAFSGHKLYAPFGAGVLVGRRDWLDAAPAHLPGGGAVREVAPDGSAEWAPAPQRHEGGTPNVLGTAALAAACRAVAALPAGALAAHEEALAERLRAGLSSLPGVRLLQVWSDSTDRVGVVGFTLTGHDPGRVAAYLSAEHGIGVRDGRFCAHPLLARLGVPGGALRASFGVGSGSEDVDRLISALRQLVEQGEGWDYRLDAGRWAPTPDPRPAPAWATWQTDAPAGTSPCGS